MPYPNGLLTFEEFIEERRYEWLPEGVKEDRYEDYCYNFYEGQDCSDDL